jgi:putative heme-binding domain-containing protein
LEIEKNPTVRRLVARRLAEHPELAFGEWQGLAALLVYAKTLENERAVIDLLAAARREIETNKKDARFLSWEVTYDTLRRSRNVEIRDISRSLAVLFGDERETAETVKLVLDSKADGSRREAALQSLVSARSKQTRTTLAKLLDDGVLRSAAIRSLAGFSDERVAAELIDRFSNFDARDRSAAIATLVSRPAFALALLDAVEAKAIDRKDLGPFELRQLANLKDAAVAKRLDAVWGTVRATPKDKSALLAKYKKLFADDDPAKADQVRGRELYGKHCGACHKLFGEGGAIGPDITGSQRANLDYLLENVLDPSAIVPREYRVTAVVTTSGRTVSGIVKEATDRALTVQTPTELIVIPVGEIEERRETPQSMMPDGILEALSPEDARALIAYLRRN